MERHLVTLTDPLSLAWLQWMHTARTPSNTVARCRCSRGLRGDGRRRDRDL